MGNSLCDQGYPSIRGDLSGSLRSPRLSRRREGAREDLTHGAENVANLPQPKVEFEVPVEGAGGTELSDEGKLNSRRRRGRRHVVVTREQIW